MRDSNDNEIDTGLYLHNKNKALYIVIGFCPSKNSITGVWVRSVKYISATTGKEYHRGTDDFNSNFTRYNGEVVFNNPATKHNLSKMLKPIVIGETSDITPMPPGRISPTAEPIKWTVETNVDQSSHTVDSDDPLSR